jgi:hypothetical protein
MKLFMLCFLIFLKITFGTQVSDDSCAIRGNQYIEDKFNVVGLYLLVIILFLIALSYVFICVKVSTLQVIHFLNSIL